MTIRTALVTLLAIALFAWFLSRANLSSVLSEIAHARTDLIVWSIICSLVTPLMRAVRWRYLLDPIGPTRFGPVLKATLVGLEELRDPEAARRERRGGDGRGAAGEGAPVPEEPSAPTSGAATTAAPTAAAPAPATPTITTHRTIPLVRLKVCCRISQASVTRTTQASSTQVKMKNFDASERNLLG